jgi:hypothetical protein
MIKQRSAIESTQLICLRKPFILRIWYIFEMRSMETPIANWNITNLDCSMFSFLKCDKNSSSIYQSLNFYEICHLSSFSGKHPLINSSIPASTIPSLKVKVDLLW